jgi:hypothetical protein
MAFDLYPVDLTQNKKRLTDQAAREGWVCVFVHDPDVPWGRIVDEVQREEEGAPGAKGRGQVLGFR